MRVLKAIWRGANPAEPRSAFFNLIYDLVLAAMIIGALVMFHKIFFGN